MNVRAPYGVPDDGMAVSHPLAWRFLTDRQFPGGKTREVPRVSLEALSDGWRLSVSDYNLSVKGTVEFPLLRDLWGSFEALMKGRRGKWVEIKSGEGYKRRKAEEERQLASRPDELYTLAKGGGDPKKQK